MVTALIVDDSTAFTEPLAYVLRDAGYEVKTASDGRAALDTVLRDPPQLILLDLIMPRMDGRECLRQIRADRRGSTIPVILVTAATDPQQILDTARLGIQDYMLKSRFSLNQLLAKIDRLAPLTPRPQHPSQPKPPTQPRPAEHPESAEPAPPPLSPKPQAPTLPLHPQPENPLPRSPIQAVNDLRPIAPRSFIIDQIEKHCELHAMPGSVGELTKLARSNSSSMDDIVRVLKRDQAVSFKIMRVANSAAYERGRMVDSVRQAVINIGVSQVCRVALSIAVMESFDPDKDYAGIDPLRLWEHNIAVALIAASIAEAIGADRHLTDTLFTAGLLHDVGRLVFAAAFTDRYRLVLDTAARLNAPLEQVEQRMLLHNHADIMHKLLHAWQFPPDLVDPIALHHYPLDRIRSMSRNRWRECASLALADRVAHAALLGSSGNDLIYPLAAFLDALEVPTDALSRILAKAPDQVDDLRSALLARSMSHVPTLREETLRSLIGIPAPLLIAPQPHNDPFRILTASLWPSRAAQPPRVALLHVPARSLQPALARHLLHAEARIGLPPLPVIVVSPSGDITLDPSVVGERTAVQLRLPTPFRQLLDTMRSLTAAHPPTPVR